MFNQMYINYNDSIPFIIFHNSKYLYLYHSKDRSVVTLYNLEIEMLSDVCLIWKVNMSEVAGSVHG